MSGNSKHLNIFQSQKHISLSQYRSFEEFTPKSLRVKEEERKIIKFSVEKEKEEVEKLQWRRKTQFPIVKILDYRKLNKPQPSSQFYLSKKVLVQLTIEPIFYSLAEVDQIPIFKVFYLLKQALIGVQRLCNVYGNFLLKSSMIGIDSKKRCKVWHNSRLHLNKPEFRCQNQEQTVRSVVAVFAQKTKISFKSNKFYHDLQQCINFCECLLVLKNFTLSSQTRIPSTFMLIDKFSSNLCSPRKYISRPPSGEHNPESSENPLGRLRSPNVKNHNATQSLTWKFANITNRTKLNSLAQIPNSRSPDLTFRKKQLTSPRKTQRNVFGNYFNKKSTKIQETESVSPKSINKPSIFTLTAKAPLCMIDSVFEGDSQCPSIYEPCDNPRIRLLQPVIKDDQSDGKNDTVLYRSSTSLGRSFTENEWCQNMMGSGDFQTNDQVIFPIKGEQIAEIFRPFMKLIDKSFDEGYNGRF